MDTVSKSQRSYNMSRIRSKNTKPEIVVRQKLYNQGLRYRLHVKHLSGRPDIVIKKYKLIIEIRGCFWHGHRDCKYYSSPKTNSSYWSEKISRNKKRDKENGERLIKEGFKVFIIWECETKKIEVLNSKVEEIVSYKETLM